MTNSLNEAIVLVFETEKLKKMSDVDLLSVMEEARKKKDKKREAEIVKELKRRGVSESVMKKKAKKESDDDEDDSDDDDSDDKKKKKKKGSKDEVVVHEDATRAALMSFGSFTKQLDEDNENENIIMQLRKAVSISKHVTFENGITEAVDLKVANDALSLHTQAVGAEAKEKLQQAFMVSLDSLLDTLK